MRNKGLAFVVLLGLGVASARPVYGGWVMVYGLEGLGVVAVGSPSDAHRLLAESPFALHGLGETALADSAFRPVHDPWLGFDKVQHATFSLLFVLGGQYMLVNKANWGDPQALPLSIGFTAALGLAKEFYDWRISPSRYFSGRDLVADALGIAAGFVLIVI